MVDEATAGMLRRLRDVVAQIESLLARAQLAPTAARDGDGADLGSLVHRLERCIAEADDRIQTIKQLSMQSERRRAARIGVGGTINLRLDGRELAAQLLDIAEGGLRCSLEGELPPRVGDLAEVDLPLDGRPVIIPATVVRRESVRGVHTVALQFEPLPVEMERELRSYVSRAGARS